MGGVASVIMAMLLVSMIPAPMPWMMRKIMSCIGVMERLVRAEPMVKIKKPLVYTRFLP